MKHRHLFTPILTSLYLVGCTPAAVIGNTPVPGVTTPTQPAVPASAASAAPAAPAAPAVPVNPVAPQATTATLAFDVSLSTFDLDLRENPVSAVTQVEVASDFSVQQAQNSDTEQQRAIEFLRRLSFTLGKTPSPLGAIRLLKRDFNSANGIITFHVQIPLGSDRVTIANRTGSFFRAVVLPSVPAGLITVSARTTALLLLQDELGANAPTLSPETLERAAERLEAVLDTASRQDGARDVVNSARVRFALTQLANTLRTGNAAQLANLINGANLIPPSGGSGGGSGGGGAPVSTPTISATNQNDGRLNATTTLTITGTGFVNKPAVRVGATDIDPANVVFDSATQLTVTVPAGLTAGFHNVRVTNPDTGTVTRTNGFEAVPAVGNVFRTWTGVGNATTGQSDKNNGLWLTNAANELIRLQVGTNYDGNPSHSGNNLLFAVSNANEVTYIVEDTTPGNVRTFSWLNGISMSTNVQNTPTAVATRSSAIGWVANGGSSSASFVMPGMAAPSVTNHALSGNPDGVAVDGSNFAVFAIPSQDRLEKVSYDGGLALSSTNINLAAGDAPTKVVADPNGNIWALAPGNDRVYYLPTGGAISAAATVGDNPTLLGVDSSGNAWVYSAADFKLHRITPGATPTPTLIHTFGAAINSLVVSPNGHCWTLQETGGGNWALRRWASDASHTEVTGTFTTNVKLLAAGPNNDVFLAIDGTVQTRAR